MFNPSNAQPQTCHPHWKAVVLWRQISHLVQGGPNYLSKIRVRGTRAGPTRARAARACAAASPGRPPEEGPPASGREQCVSAWRRWRSADEVAVAARERDATPAAANPVPGSPRWPSARAHARSVTLPALRSKCVGMIPSQVTWSGCER